MLARASSDGRGFERLATRRRRRRRVARIAFFILLLFLLAAGMYGLRQPVVRITQVTIIGGDAALATYASNAMQGFYFGLIPRDSFFFVPESQIRRTLLADHPEFAAVSIARTNLTKITITVIERTAIARWCGVTPTSTSTESCYAFDPNGFIFALATSTISVLNPFSLYVPLANGVTEPLRTAIPNAERLPATFDFARRIGSFGSPVVNIVIRDSEIDDTLASGTRITYVLGNEQSAITALVSASPGLNLTNGALEYVDLRFDGKVYLKKK